jgi:pyruvate carboxylase subunit B
MMDDAIWGMILGKSGKVPGTIAPELIELAEKKGLKFTDADPHTLLENALDGFRKEMDENGWEYGPDDEELFELAMHPEQYRAYKSGKAKADFEADLAKRKAAKNAPAAGAAPAELPKSITVTVNGQNYKVDIAYGGEVPAAADTKIAALASAPAGEGADLLAPLEGKFYRVKDSSEVAKNVGDAVKEGDVVGYIEAMKTYNAIKADRDGVITAILVNSGDSVEEDDVIMKIG